LCKYARGQPADKPGYPATQFSGAAHPMASLEMRLLEPLALCNPPVVNNNLPGRKHDESLH
jgi:hypothetical protein